MRYKEEIFCAEWPSILCESTRNCEKCGWDPQVHAQRVAAIRKGEMQIDEDGLMRLHINKEDIETDAD